MKEKKTKISLKIIFDIFVITSLGALFILEILNVIDIHLKNRLTFDLIIVLLPAIITIVSISLSLSKENVYGVSLDDFSKLRKKSIYSLTHMVIIMCLSITLYTLFYYFETKLASTLLIIFCFFYSIIFSIQEIPFLARKKERLNKIIKYSYKNKEKREDFLAQKNNETLYCIMRYIVLNEGIITAYNTLKMNKGKKVREYNSALFDYLMTSQNKYLYNASLDIEVLLSNLSGKYKNNDILTAIDTAYSNVEVLLSNDEQINIEKDFPDSKTYHLARTIFALHNLCVNLSFEKKEKEKLNNIIICILLYIRKGSNKVKSFATLMSIDSLKNGNTWFIKHLRDNSLYPSTLFSFDGCLLGLFISIYLAHTFNKNILSNEKISDVTAFLSEPSLGLNSDGSSWNQLLTRMIELSNPKLIINSISELIDIYKSIDESYYYSLEDSIIVDNSKCFNEIDIIDAWLEIILFGKKYDVDKNDVVKVIDSLDDYTKSDLVETLSKKWFIDNELNNNYQIRFLKYFGIEADDVEENFYNKDIIQFLAEYKKDYYYSIERKKIANDNVDIEDMMNRIKSTFNSYIRDNEFVDKTINLSEEKTVFFSWRLEKGNLEQMLEVYLKQLPESIMYTFRKKIESSLEPEFIEDYKLTGSQIEKITRFQPDLYSSLIGLIYNSIDEINTIVDNVTLSRSKMLPFNLFFKDGAIKVNVEYDEEQTNVRTLSDEEIDYIIDNEYQLINGLYRFSEYSNDTTRSILVTRDELKGILNDKLMYAFIVFKAKIVIDKEKCLWFKLKRRNQ